MCGDTTTFGSPNTGWSGSTGSLANTSGVSDEVRPQLLHYIRLYRLSVQAPHRHVERLRAPCTDAMATATMTAIFIEGVVCD